MSETLSLPREVRNVTPYDFESFKQGRKVGYYLLGRVVGEGSFAKVREGVHIITGEKVAVKIIDKKRAKEDRYISKNMHREPKILQLVRHPNIIQLLEVLETENFTYLVMEFCAGGELLDYICTRKRLVEELAKRLVSQLVSAVKAMHKEGIVHRDLKIENFLLNENYDLKIIDFGLSNIMPIECMRSFRKTGIYPQLLNTHCGSPAYAAPELLAQKNYGPQVDVWSIGINMYAMLTGFLPYMMEPFNVMEMYEKMMQRKMTPIPSFLSKECRDLLMRLLEPVPEWRITLKQVLKHKWVCDTQPIPQTLGDIMYAQKELCESVLHFMKHSLKIKTEEAVNAIVANKASHPSAVYHLLVKRLDRYLREKYKEGEQGNKNFSKLEIIKKASLAAPKRMAVLDDISNNRSSGVGERPLKRFSFRGRKINTFSKSQPNFTTCLDDDIPVKTGIPNIVGNETRSSPDSISVQVKAMKTMRAKKEKVTRTHSDRTHTRNKDHSEYKNTTTRKIVKTLDSTPEMVEKVCKVHRKLKRSASSDNEENVRTSIRNSLICDSDQDLFKPVLPNTSSSNRNPESPIIDYFPLNDNNEDKTRTNLSIERLNTHAHNKKRISLGENVAVDCEQRDMKRIHDIATKPNPSTPKCSNVTEPPSIELIRESPKTFEQGTKTFEHNSKTFEQETKTFEHNTKTFEHNSKQFEQETKTIENNQMKTLSIPHTSEMKRSRTSDSIKTLTKPLPFYTTKRRYSSDFSLGKNNDNHLETIVPMNDAGNSRYKRKVESSIQDEGIDNSTSMDETSLETPPELESIINNIAYINKHHLNDDGNDGDERLGVENKCEKVTTVDDKERGAKETFDDVIPPVANIVDNHLSVGNENKSSINTDNLTTVNNNKSTSQNSDKLLPLYTDKSVSSINDQILLRNVLRNEESFSSLNDDSLSSANEESDILPSTSGKNFNDTFCHERIIKPCRVNSPSLTISSDDHNTTEANIVRIPENGSNDDIAKDNTRQEGNTRPASNIRLTGDTRPASNIRLTGDTRPASNIRLTGDTRPPSNNRLTNDTRPASTPPDIFVKKYLEDSSKKTNIVVDENNNSIRSRRNSPNFLDIRLSDESRQHTTSPNNNTDINTASVRRYSDVDSMTPSFPMEYLGHHGNYRRSRDQDDNRPLSTPPDTFIHTYLEKSNTKSKTTHCNHSNINHLDKNNNNNDNNGSNSSGNSEIKRPMTPNIVVFQPVKKLESFQNDQVLLQTPLKNEEGKDKKKKRNKKEKEKENRNETRKVSTSKITSSIKHIVPSKRVVELKVRQLALFRKRHSSSPAYEFGDHDYRTPPKPTSPTLKPLEINFDFVQMKERASRLKNLAKSMPNFNNIDDDVCLDDDVGENCTSSTSLYHGDESSSCVSGKKKTIDKNLGATKYYSSLSLTTTGNCH